MGDDGLLFVPDLARIATDELRKTDPGRAPIKESTVWSWHKESWVVAGGRYRDNPMPRAQRAGQKVMYWLPEQEADFRAWLRSRPGRGRRGGQRRAG